MNKHVYILGIATLLLVACGKKEEQVENVPPAHMPESEMIDQSESAAGAMKGDDVAPETEGRVDEAPPVLPDEDTGQISDTTDNTLEKAEAATDTVVKKTGDAASKAQTSVKEGAQTAAKETKQAVTEVAAKTSAAVGATSAALSQDDALALANKSGCLACHAVDKKVVGPAWQDVAARYRGENVRATLIDKVSTGGKGNWTDITGGVPMPPYAPRVSKENIEKLVDFILSLK